METQSTFAVHRYFPGPPSTGDTNTRLRGQTIHAGGAAPAVYRIADLTRESWKALWWSVSTCRPFCVAAPPPRLGTRHVLLVFDAEDRESPLCLSGKLVQNDCNKFSVSAATPSLSWRLAAVDFGCRLPTQRPDNSPPPTQLRARAGSLRGRRIRLRPDLPGPASAIGPTAEQTRLVMALRSGYYDIDDLIEETAVDRSAALPFLAALVATGLVLDAPRPLESTVNPFDHLALHWTAYPDRIERNFRALQYRLDSCGADDDTRRCLHDSYEMLADDDRRCRLRHELAPPPVIGEVSRYLRSHLEKAIVAHHTPRAIDLGKRILELDPTDSRVRETIDVLIP